MTADPPQQPHCPGAGGSMGSWVVTGFLGGDRRGQTHQPHTRPRGPDMPRQFHAVPQGRPTHGALPLRQREVSRIPSLPVATGGQTRRAEMSDQWASLSFLLNPDTAILLNVGEGWFQKGSGSSFGDKNGIFFFFRQESAAGRNDSYLLRPCRVCRPPPSLLA